MPRPRPSTDLSAPCGGHERGSASLEFIVAGLILLVPLVYLVVALGAIQGQSLGAEAGARHIARAVATAGDVAHARARADSILDSVVREYGMDATDVTLEIACRPAGPSCPTAGATLTVTLTSRVRLPLIPAVLGLEAIAAIPIEATSAQRVSRFWSGS